MDKRIESIKAQAKNEPNWISQAELINRLSHYIKRELACDMIHANAVAAKYVNFSN